MDGDAADHAENELLAAFRPNADALLRRISGHIDDATLQWIAELDSGMNVEGYLRELRQIRDRGIVRYPFSHEPRQVLQFACHFEPDAENPAARRIGSLTREQAHWARAFAGAALIRAFGDDDVMMIVDGCNFSLIQMLESLRALEADFDREAMAALAWLIVRLKRFAIFHEEDRAFSGVGMLALAVHAREPFVDQGLLLRLAEWVIAEELRAFEESGEATRRFSGRWLLRTSHFVGVSYRKWEALGRELAAFDATGRSGDVVRDIGNRLAGSGPAGIR